MNKSKAELLKALAAYNIAPSKYRGQNFLVDPNMLQAMVDSMNLKPGELVLEVGPGCGVLSSAMLEAGCILHSVELDHGIQRYLKDNLDHENFTLHCGDACKEDYETMLQLPREFRCIANLPYAISSIFVARMIELNSPPTEMYFLVQKEMAERVASEHSRGDYSALSVRVQAMYEVKILRNVPPGCFHPPPKVMSAFISMSLKQERPSNLVNRKIKALTRTAFAQRRKVALKLLTGIAPKERLQELYAEFNIRLDARAEHISVEQYISLATALCAAGEK